METNEADREPTSTPTGSTDVVQPRRSRRRALWRGVKAGVKLASYLAWPVAGILATLNVALTVFAAGSGRGLGISPYFPVVVGVFLVIEALGGFLGGLVGLIGGLFGRFQPQAPRPSEPIPLDDPTETFPAETRRLRWPWVAGVLFALTQVIALAGGIIAGRAVDRRLADAIKAADVDHPSWRIEDLLAARPPIADAVNSAVVVNQVLALLPKFWPDVLPPENVENPPPDLLNPALERLDATPDDIELDQGTANVLRQELKTQSEAVRLARTVADLDQGRFPLVLGSTLFDTRLPQGFTTREVAKLLVADAAVRAQDGDIDGAIESCRAILGLARSLGDEPMLVSQLVRMKIGVTAVNTALRVLAQGEPSDAVLGRLQSQLLDELDQPHLLIGFQSERGMGTEIIRRLSTGEMPVSAMGGDFPSIDPKAPREPMSPWGRLALENQEAIELEWTNRLIAIARRPQIEHIALFKGWQNEVDRVKQTWFSEKLATLPLLFAGVQGATTKFHPRYRAEMGSMVILLAAERQRRQTGGWPGSIAAIDPSLLPRAPVDPYTGEPFRISRLGGQFLVYSIGPNLEDEQGLGFQPRVSETRPWREGQPDDLGAYAWDISGRRLAADPLPTPDETPGPP